MDQFLPVKDLLSENIQGNAAMLFKKLSDLPVEKLGLPLYCLDYFKKSHFKRLFFSIETSARLLYRAISLANKPANEIVIMDYGAGVGTLYTLAKMIGCKKVIYNDFLSDWKESAKVIAEAINIKIDEYILGDIEETLRVLSEKKINCDIITSRNVIEHIYDLRHFYSCILKSQPNTIIYSSTTANSKNPGTRVQHVRLHKRLEKIYFGERIKIIRGKTGLLNETYLVQLATSTKGLAGTDLEKSINHYLNTKKIPEPLPVRSNTCDPVNGVWVEHLLYFSEYNDLIGSDKFNIEFAPGFWDTHYQQGWKNIVGGVLNRLINANKTVGFFVAPFIYVIASKK